MRGGIQFRLIGNLGDINFSSETLPNVELGKCKRRLWAMSANRK
jgi:hypothetical protein